MPNSWPEAWHLIQDVSLQNSLERELVREIGPNHILFGRSCTVLAKRNDQDDILIELDNHQVCEIHLTWGGKPEADPRWPSASVFASIDDWLQYRSACR